MIKKWAIPMILAFTQVIGADITGEYKVSGHDPYAGTDYTGTASIHADGDTYQAIWHIEPNLTYVGMGISDGGCVSMVYQNPENQQESGLQLYHVEGNQLIGKWISLGKKKIGTETLTKK